MAKGADSKDGTKKRGCRGCLKWLGILLVILLVLAAIFFRVPDRLGLVGGGSAQKMFSGTPDREASAAVLREAASAGLATQGIAFYLLPVADTEDEEVAFALLDATEGFTFTRGQGDPVIGTLIALNATATIQSRNVKFLGLEFFDEDGRSYMTVAARPEDIAKVAQGTMTEEEFMAAAYGEIRFDEIFNAEMQQLQEFLSQ